MQAKTQFPNTRESGHVTKQSLFSLTQPSPRTQPETALGRVLTKTTRYLIERSGQEVRAAYLREASRRSGNASPPTGVRNPAGGLAPSVCAVPPPMRFRLASPCRGRPLAGQTDMSSRSPTLGNLPHEKRLVWAMSDVTSHESSPIGIGHCPFTDSDRTHGKCWCYTSDDAPFTAAVLCALSRAPNSQSVAPGSSALNGTGLDESPELSGGTGSGPSRSQSARSMIRLTRPRTMRVPGQSAQRSTHS